MRFLILSILSLTFWGVVVSQLTDYPQIVVLSFDDAVDQTLYDYFYAPLFNLTNPDQCTIGLTFLVSHDYTDYTFVHDLWQRGHEIASHSISHQSPATYWMDLDYQGWVDEMYGMKEIASNFANIPLEDIVGSRAPFYTSNSPYFSAIYNTNFSYDNTWSTMVEPPLYPFQLVGYPGLWEFPLNYCSMIDSCATVTGTNATFEYLLSNFNRYYESGRVPLQMSTHTSWFETDSSHYPGYLMFLEYLGTLDDVYVMTMAKALEWVKNTTKLADLPDFKPWECVQPRSQCKPVICFYESTSPGGERLMGSCVACPPNYPWLNDPYGNSTGV